jgi:hypothetical protein
MTVSTDWKKAPASQIVCYCNNVNKEQSRKARKPWKPSQA